jgi:hypothetical protein
MISVEENYLSWFSFCAIKQTFEMRTTDAKQQRKALESYIKGLLQDFTNETDLHIEEIEIISSVHPVTNKRVIKDVKAKLDRETLIRMLP